MEMFNFNKILAITGTINVNLVVDIGLAGIVIWIPINSAQNACKMYIPTNYIFCQNQRIKI